MKQIEEIKRMHPNVKLLRHLKRAVWIISVIVLGLVALMRQVKIPLPESVSLDFLPSFHALLNTLAAISLLMALVAIKKGNAILHQRWIYSAMICSFVFLLSYVAYHFTTPETIFGDLDGNGLLSEQEQMAIGSMRMVYLVVLLSHIALAAFSLPFILLTFSYGFTHHFEKHRKLAKKIYPVWLYVAVTGPVVYLMLKPYY